MNTNYAETQLFQINEDVIEELSNAESDLMSKYKDLVEGNRQLSKSKKRYLLAMLYRAQHTHSAVKDFEARISIQPRQHVETSPKNLSIRSVIDHALRPLKAQLSNTIGPFIYDPYNVAWLPIEFTIEVAACAPVAVLKPVMVTAWEFIHMVVDGRLLTLSLMPFELPYLQEVKASRDLTFMDQGTEIIPPNPWIAAAKFRIEVEKYYAHLNEVSGIGIS